jgi:hypothetical protein
MLHDWHSIFLLLLGVYGSKSSVIRTSIRMSLYIYIYMPVWYTDICNLLTLFMGCLCMCACVWFQS